MFQFSKMSCLILRTVIALFAIPTVLTSSYSCNNCNVTSIPAPIPSETTHLYLVGNRIRSISRSSLLALTKLTLLDISRNSIANVDIDSFYGFKITKLVLSHNQITAVPKIESLAYSLTWLDLRNNLIATVEPFTFANFTVLRELYLTANSITSLPDYAIHAPLASFYRVLVNANPLVELSRFAFAGLRTGYLFLNHNKLTEFPCLNNITTLHNVYLQANPISTIPNGCGQWWRRIFGVEISYTQLASLDGITKHTYGLRRLEVKGGTVTVSNETFKYTPYLYKVTMSDVNQFPQFYSSKTTLQHLEIGGRGIRCIDESHLDGLNILHTFKLWHASIDRLPDPGCSHEVAGNHTRHGYFKSLLHMMIYRCNLKEFPSLHTAVQLVSLNMVYNRISRIHDAEIPAINALSDLRLYRDRLLHFPNLTLLGDNSSLTILWLSENKISSVPCFPDTFKMLKLAKIYLYTNNINYICNMNFAPNIQYIYLNKNPLIGVLFMESTTVPLPNLYNISIQYNNIDFISDSALRVIPNCRLLQMDANNIISFPNIKLLSSSVIYVELHDNMIPDVPCTALDVMEKLLTLHLNDNLISYVCPQILTLAPKLVYLGLSGNRLLEIADLRVPTRMQLTDVLLNNNPFRCLTNLCWMLFVPTGSYLQLKLENTFCVDGDDIEVNIIAGLTIECTCKGIDFYQTCMLSSCVVILSDVKSYSTRCLNVLTGFDMLYYPWLQKSLLTLSCQWNFRARKKSKFKFHEFSHLWDISITHVISEAI